MDKLTSQLNSIAEAFVLVSNRDSGSQKRRESRDRKERMRRYTAEEYADHTGVTELQETIVARLCRE